MENNDEITEYRNVIEENKYDEFTITDFINNNNNENFKIKNNYKKSSSTRNNYRTKNKMTKIKLIANKKNLSISSENCKKYNYIFREKIPYKTSKNNTISNNYNLYVSPVKRFINLKKENNVIDINKYVHTSSFIYPKDKINPVLKNNQNSNKTSQNIIEKNKDKKIKTRNKKNNKVFDVENINILDTLQIHLENKTKEMIKSRNNKSIVAKTNKENNFKLYTNEFEKTKNYKQHSIDTKISKKENLYFLTEEELLKYTNNKIKEKNSYYLIELKNKSYKYNMNETITAKTKTKENEKKYDKNNPEIYKIKEDNNNLMEDNIKLKEENIRMKSRYIKLKSDFEQIYKEFKLLKEKNKEIKNDINKKEILIKIYESKLSEEQNKIQNLTKSLCEYTKYKNRIIFIFQREIELSFLNNIKKNKQNKWNFNQLEIKNIIKLYYETKKKNKKFDANLSIENIEKLNFLYNKEKDDKKLFMNFEISNTQELNYIKIDNVKQNNSKIFEINKINDIYFEKTNKKLFINFEISNTQELNYKKIENVKKNNSKIFEINKINDIYFEKTNKKLFINFEISNIQELSYIEIENIKKNNSNNINKIFEIDKINDIYFEKIKKSNSNSFNGNLSIENIFDFKIIQKEKRKSVFESENLFMETAEDFEFIIFKIPYLEISEPIILTFLKDKLNLKNNKKENIETKKEKIEQNFKRDKSNNIRNINPSIDKTELNFKKKKLEEIKEEKGEEKKKELNLNKDDKSQKLNRAMNRIGRKNQSIVANSNIINSEEFQDLISNRSRGRSDTVNFGKSGKILDIAKKLELQMNKGDDNDDRNIEPKKNEISNNLITVISKQPIVKKKKKKSKINLEYED